MKENFKLGIILLIIAAAAGLILSVAHSVTMKPILAKEKEEKEAAMKVVLHEAVSFETVKIDESEEVVSAEAGIKDGKKIGYCINVSSKGYGGPINMMVGITEDGKVEGVKILSLSETPGLGSKTQDPEFIDQFKDKPASELSVVKDNASSDNQIQAVSGATISSSAVTTGVNNAIKLFNDTLKGGN